MDLSDDVSREVIREADIIIGVDKVTGAETIFFGQSLLTLVEGGYEGPEGLEAKVLRVPVDFGADSDEPEWLAAECLVVKGSQDFVDLEEGDPNGA
jgi:hypothetical protein